MKRLFIDIETSPNIVFSWRVGYNINLSYKDIIKERAIICVCYRFEGEKKVHSITWDNGDDKPLLEKFIPIFESADEVVAHNGNRFDMKWLRARAAFHGIRVSPYVKTVDTLRLSKKGFYFNSHRLDYVGEFLGLGGKLDHGEAGLWTKVMDGSKAALRTMVSYCKRDVELLEDFYHRIEDYGPVTTHAGVLAGRPRVSCPRCTSENTHRRGTRTSGPGIKQRLMSCVDCNRHFLVPFGREEDGTKQEGKSSRKSG